MENEKLSRNPRNPLLFSIAAGLTAMALFLALYYLFSSQRKDVFFEGEGKYIAFMASAGGVSSETGGMEIELKSDGKCYVNLNGKSKTGKWKRAGDRIEITVGRHKMTGAFTGELLELMSDEAGETRIGFLKKDTAETAEIPTGHWKLVSVTDVEEVYTEALLRKLGYEDSYIEIYETGSGTAKLLHEPESEITVVGDYINCQGMLLPFSFSEDQMVISYAEGMTLSFEK